MIKSKFNSLYIGLLSGIMLPFLTLIFFYLIRNKEESFSIYLKIGIEHNILANLISLAAIPNALLFFIFIWTNKLRSARGVIFALFLIALFVLIIKLIP